MGSHLIGNRALSLRWVTVAFAATLLAGCVSSNLKNGATHVKLQTDQSEQELSFGIMPENPALIDATIILMQRPIPNWHIFLVSTPKEPRNADVLVKTTVDCGFFNWWYGIEATSVYSKEVLYRDKRFAFMCANVFKKTGTMLKNAFYPGSELHAKIMAQKAEFLKRQEAAKPVSTGLSKAEMASMMAEAVATAQVKSLEKVVPQINSDVDHSDLSLPEHPDDFAIVMGVEKYSDLPAATYAERDAEAVMAHLLAMGYPSRNVIQLIGEKAGRSSMEKFLETWLPRNVNENSRVFFYFSGHGAPDPKTGEAYLIPWDGDPSFLENTGYPIKRLYEKLSALKAKEVIVAMDACFSGAGGRSVLAKGARPLVTKVDTATVPDKLTVFAAASGDQITSTLEDQGHGTFTYYFLKGLSGGAKDASGRVTTQALYDYLKPKVQDAARRQNRDQEPVLHSQGDRELVRF